MNTPDESTANDLSPDLSPGVHQLDAGTVTAAALVSAKQAGWATAVVDVADTGDKAGLLDAFADALYFPSWVGRNWDALDDALRDLSWWPAGDRGRLVLIRGVDMADLRPIHVSVLLDVLYVATASWAETDTPLVALIQPQG